MVQKCGSASGMSTAFVRTACAICRQSVAIMLVAVRRPVARWNSAITSRPEKPPSAPHGSSAYARTSSQAAQQADGVVEQPAAVGVEGDPGLGEALVQRGDGSDLLVAGEHAALELEVGEAVALLRGLGQARRRPRGSAPPRGAAAPSRRRRRARAGRAGRSRPGRRRRRGSRASARASRCWPSPSSSATGTPRSWPCRSSSADSSAVTACTVVRRSKVCRPRPPASRSAKRSATSRSSERYRATGWPTSRAAGLLDGRPDRLAARHLAEPVAAVGVGDDRDVAGEERAVRAAEVEQHRVVARRPARPRRGRWWRSWQVAARRRSGGSGPTGCRRGRPRAAGRPARPGRRPGAGSARSRGCRPRWCGSRRWRGTGRRGPWRGPPRRRSASR